MRAGGVGSGSRLELAVVYRIRLKFILTTEGTESTENNPTVLLLSVFLVSAGKS